MDKGNIVMMTDAEMRQERIWPFDKPCSASGICPDGHRISCQATMVDETTCKEMYVSFGGSGTFDNDLIGVMGSGTESELYLHGVVCGDQTIYCNDRPSSDMPRKVTACLYKREWDTCTYLSPDGNDKGGYCRYGDPGDSNNPYRTYLYCSDLGVPSRP